MKSINLISALGMAVIMSGCANLNTVGRTSPLPNDGKAIHLDIQQRTVMVNRLGQYCAEPSPDALAAFAASLGISASNPASNAISAAGSTGSAAASIGLRTQSITLMRDAMYRICEAYGNGQIGKAQVATLIGRSQDLTAVILAVEQLTGPTVASQATLAAASSSTAYAGFKAVSEQYEIVAKRLDRLREERTNSQADKDAAQAKVDKIESELSAHTAELQNQSNPPSANRKAELEKVISQKNQRKSELDADLKIKENILKDRTEAVSTAQKQLNKLSEKQDEAFSSASSNTSSSGSLSGGGVRGNITDGVVKEVAGAVTDMVNNVVNKNYVEENCLSLLSLEVRVEQDDKSFRFSNFAEENTTLKDACIELIKAKVELEQAKAETEIKTERNR